MKRFCRTNEVQLLVSLPVLESSSNSKNHLSNEEIIQGLQHGNEDIIFNIIFLA